MTTPDMDPDVDALVVGGGIGGLATSLALARSGRTVRVLEQAPEFGEVGAGLQMAPNATRILRGWGLLDEVIDHGVAPRRLVMRDALDNKELTYLDLADTARRYGAPYIVIHRSDLHAILVRACRAAGVDLVTNAAVTDVKTATDQATAIGEHRRDTGRIVIAADGLGSRLRGRLSNDDPVSSAYVAYRGALPLADLPDTSGLALDDVVVHIGPGCHLVQYPLRRGEMFNQVAVFRSAKALAGRTTGAPPTNSTPPSPPPATPSAPPCPTSGATAGGGCTTANPSTPGSMAASPSPATPPTPCFNTSPKAPARPSRTPNASPNTSANTPQTPEPTGTRHSSATPRPAAREPPGSSALLGNGAISGTATASSEPPQRLAHRPRSR